MTRRCARLTLVLGLVSLTAGGLVGCGDKGATPRPAPTPAATATPVPPRSPESRPASLPVDVKVQKPRPAEWSLRIRNLSGAKWTNTVVEIVSTAHGAGYVRELGTVAPGEDGARRLDCFECQRPDGGRFNPLHMNLRAIRIRCDQGEAEVPAVEEESEESKLAREREEYFRKQEQTAKRKQELAAVTPEEVARLVASLESPEKPVVAAAEKALRELGEAEVQLPEEPLFRLLESARLETRKTAASLIAASNLDLKKRMDKAPWVLAEAPVVPRLLACVKQGDPGLAAAAEGALRSFERRSNFRNKARAAGEGWEEWWDLVKFEKATIDRVRDDCNKAAAIIESGDKQNFGDAGELLGKCEVAYDALKEKGSIDTYERGEFGLAAIRNARVLVRKGRAND